MRLVLRIMSLLLLLAAVLACENPATTTTADLLAALPDPAAKYAYGITNTQTYNGGVIRSYSVSRNGVVPVDSLSIPVLATGITAYPLKNALYVICCTTTDGYIYQYTVGSNGTLSAMSVPSVLFAEYPLKLVIHPSGNFAYMLDSYNYGVFMFAIDAGGALSSPTLVSAKNQLFDIVIDHSGKYLYTTGYDTVYQYSINADGTLTPMTPATAAGSAGQMFGLVTDQADKYFYGSDAPGNSVLQYTIGATGGLTAMNPASFESSGKTPSGSAINSNGSVLYVMSGDGIERFLIAGNGTLSSVSMLTLAGNLQRMNIDSTGAYAFVVQWAEGGDIGKIHQYGIVDSAGTLKSLPTASVSISGLKDFALFQ